MRRYKWRNWSYGKRLSDWNWLIRLRRPIGVASFLYAAVHFALYLALDLGFNWSELAGDLRDKPYIVIGIATFVLLFPLALTSTDAWMRRLQRNWKRLHMLVYPAAVLAVVHFILQTKHGVTDPTGYELFEEQRKWLKTAIEPVVEMRKGVTTGAIQMDSLVQFEQGGRGEHLMNDMRTLLAEISGTAATLLTQRSQEVAAIKNLTGSILIVGGIITAILAAVVAMFLIRHIVMPLIQAVQVAKTVASGDLTSRIVADSQDETGELLQALKDMNDSLERIVGQVRTGTDAIALASNQIASDNADISARTESQANSLQETASSIEELTTTVKQNADNAKQANQLVISASDFAVKGGQVVGQVVDTMGSIKKSSRQEQSTGIEEFSFAIGHMDEMTQQNAALVEQAAAESMQEQAVSLTKVVGAFKLEKNQAAMPRTEAIANTVTNRSPEKKRVSRLR